MSSAAKLVGAGAARMSDTESFLTRGNSVEFSYESATEAFPEIASGLKPFGNIGLFQIRHPKRMTRGGIHLPDDVRATEYYNTQVARVIALGDLCFKTSIVDPDTGRRSLQDWPEGAWFKVGDYVRVPQYGGDRFAVKHQYEMEMFDEEGRPYRGKVTDEIIFALFPVHKVLGLIDGDPLTVRAFLD